MTNAAAETDLRDWQLATLKALAEIGMELARELPAQAAAVPAQDKGAVPDPVLAFSRVSRAIRLTIGLQTRILEGPKEGSKPQAENREAQARAGEDQPDAGLEDRRVTGRLRRSVTRFIAGTAIEALEREAPETERLFDALDERLDREGPDDADFAEIEVNRLALAICRDLGVDPGPEWWEEGWGVSPPPKRSFEGGGSRSGGGEAAGVSAPGAASAGPARIFRSAQAPGAP